MLTLDVMKIVQNPDWLHQPYRTRPWWQMTHQQVELTPPLP